MSGSYVWVDEKGRKRIGYYSTPSGGGGTSGRGDEDASLSGVSGAPDSREGAAGQPAQPPPPQNQSVPTQNQSVAPPEDVEVLPTPAKRGQKILDAFSNPPKPAGGGGTMVPGGWHPDKYQQTVEGQTDVPPEVRKQYAISSAYGARGAAGQYAGQEGANEAESEFARQAAVLERQSADQQDRLRQAHDEVVGGQRQLAEDLTREVVEGKVDNRRLWNDMTFGERMVHGVKAGLFGIAASLKGEGGNRYLDNFEKAMELDAQEQVRRIQEKKGERDQILNNIDALTRMFGDTKQAMLANKSMKLAALGHEIEAAKGGAKSALARANFDTMLSDIVRRKADTDMELAKLQSGKVSTAYGEKYAQPKMVGGGGGKAPKLDDLFDEGDATWVSEQRESRGLNVLEQSLQLLGEAAGLDPGHAALYAQQNPGFIANAIARNGVKDPRKLQLANDAIFTATFKERGATLTPGEAASMTQRNSIADLSATAHILGTKHKMREAEIRNASVRKRNAYDVSRALEAEHAQKYAPSVPEPQMTPTKTLKR